MYYGYDLCKNCKNSLIKRDYTKNKSNEFNKFGNICPNCGEKMILSCVSQEELKSSYKILLSQSSYKECLQNSIVMKYMNENSIMFEKEKMDSETVVFDGNPVQIYNFMDILSANQIAYSVLPEFPIRIAYYDICSTCGRPLVSKEMDAESLKDYVYTGKYCEICKEWELFTCISKLRNDKTIYKIILDIDVIWDNKLLKIMQGLIGRENINCKKGDILIEDAALNIRSCGERLKAANIIFHIIPEFKYEIQPYEEVTEEILMEILKGQKWYKENDF